MATQTNNLASTANDLTQTFSYNPASQITSVTRSNDLYAWTGHSNVDLDSTPNGLNQIGNVGAATVTHDTKGNITAVGGDTYGYSSENFLTSGPGSATLGYDPLGRLYQVAQGASTTRMGYDGLDRIAEYNGSNAIQRRYIHGPGLDNPIAWYEGSGITNRRFLSSDERGSVISVTDGAGAMLSLNKYDEYGVPQDTNLGKFGYTGQAWVPEIGLWYYKARFYRPDIGRFMQTDPIGYGAGPNVYAYVGNDPVGWTDPLGLISCAPDEVPVMIQPGWFYVHLDGGGGGAGIMVPPVMACRRVGRGGPGGPGLPPGVGPGEGPGGNGPDGPLAHNESQERICNFAQRVAERAADASANVGNVATDLALVSLGASAVAARQGNLPGALWALGVSGRAGAAATAFGGFSAVASFASGNSPRAIMNQTTSFLAKKMMPFLPDAVRDKITSPLEQEGQRCAR